MVGGSARIPLIALALTVALGSASAHARGSARVREDEAHRADWFDSRAVGGHQLRILSNGEMLFEARMRLLAGARKSVYISGYAFGDGGNWSADNNTFLQKVCERARAGVDIRLLLDSHGSRRARRFAEPLRDCGVKVLFFNPIAWGLDQANYVLHEKLMIVDGERYIIGGSGYSDYYHHAHRDSDRWYDMDLEVEGRTACQFQRIYAESWRRSVREDIRSLGGLARIARPMRLYGSTQLEPCTERDAPGGVSRVLPIHNNPFFSSRRPLLETYIQAINASKSKIRLYAPYFAPHPSFTRAIIAAIKRGVDVEIVTNTVRSSDEEDFVIVGMYYTAQKIVRAGGRIMMWDSDATMHRKGGVFDDKWALFGSDNMDRRGQNLSSESVVLTDDARIVGQLAREMEDDHRYLRVLTRQEILDHYNSVPDWKKLAAALVRDQI